MERIDAIDARLKELDELLVQEDVYTNVSRLMEINKEKEALDEVPCNCIPGQCRCKEHLGL